MGTGLGQFSVVGGKKKRPPHVCNAYCKKNGCKENRGTNAGGEPVYRADSMAKPGLGVVSE